MRNRSIELVLATWDDVEPGDIVWDEDKLLQVTGPPWQDEESRSCFTSAEGWAWPVKDLDAEHYSHRAVYHRRHDRVPVVVRGL